MGNEGARLGEGFPADQTLARLLSCRRKGKCIDQQPADKDHMGSQNPLEKEQNCIPTSVDADVSLQCSGVGELTLAVDTDVRFLPAVDSEVPFQVA